MLNELITNIDEYSVDMLLNLKKELQNLIDTKNKATTIYKHDCFTHSKYHHSKYHHYAKRLVAIDDTKDNGYAFIGDFLPTEKEAIIPNGSYVIEACEWNLYLFKVENDKKECLADGWKPNMVSFIREVKEITKL